MLYRRIRRVGLFTVILLLIGSQISFSNFYAEESNEKNERTTKAESTNINTALVEKYSNYISQNDGKQYNGSDVVFGNAEELVKDSSNVEVYEGEKVLRIEQNEEISIHINAPETALYHIGLEYLVDTEQILPTQLEMKLNNDYPFYELRNLVFESRWESPDIIPEDKYGNQIVPQPLKVIEWQQKLIGDSSYRSSDPFLIKLNKGENEISLKVIEGNLLIQSLLLTTPNEFTTYENGEVKGDGFVLIEGEDIAYRNNSSIRAGSLYDVQLTPYSSDQRLLNYLNDDSFKNPGHKVEYQFEVEESGFYYLGLNYRQDSNPDFPVFMNISIDGQIPFKQFSNYPFEYASEFTRISLQDTENGENIPVYLDKGKHTLGFQISIDHIKPAIERVEKLSSEVQALSLELTNLVGPNVDKNRDINIEEYIPGVEKQLIDWADQFKEISESLKEFSPGVDEIGEFASLKIAEEQIRSLAEDVDKLIVRKNELSTGTNSITAQLGLLLQEINNNGIALDKLYFYQNKKDIPKGKSIFYSGYTKIERLFKSFGDQDYSVKNIDDDHLQVWVNRPRQYIEIMQQLIDEQYTPKTGVKVDISLMPDQNKLILANAAGDAPDVAVGVNYALPFEIAIRGALLDLTEFEDFNDIKTRFPEGLHVPATVEGGIYALPDTMNFWVLFYRKDILETLNMPVPDTLAQVRSYLPELQRKGMNFFYPTAGMPGLKFFAGTMPIIYQNGGEFYGESIEKTMLNENDSIEGVRKLTDLFTIYNAPYDVPSFYQQFRDGSVPIGISDYFMYNLILNAAPEIANSWDIAFMPGIENGEGEISRWSAGGAESNIIFQDTNKKDESWEFLKWWSEKDVQVAFGNILQTTYGKEYIWNTANVEAFAELPWITDHKNVILDQTEWVTEVPRVPGSYMVERELSNAYNSVVLDGENLRTAIDLASKRINRETIRKLEEFGYMKDGEIIKPYPNPNSMGNKE